MKKVFYTGLILLLWSTSITWAQEHLPQSFSAEEKNLLMEKYGTSDWEEAWERFIESKKDSIPSMRKPKNIWQAPAEFAPADGVCFSWQGYSSLLKPLIKEVSLDAKAYVTVSYGASQVESTLRDFGCKMENVEIIEQRLNSVWMRDYGPFYIYTKDGDREILDLVYNRPRPLDDKFPSTFAARQGWKSHLCKLILPGGNLIIDGHGVAIMTDVVFDPSQGGDPNLSMAELRAYMKDYFGCHTVHVIEDLQRDGTGHIDMFCKLLDDRNMIVGAYAKPSDGAGNNYNILNNNAEKLAQMKNGRGENFIVHRIIMPRYTGTSYTHTNSLMVNNKVLVPIYNRGTDQEALDVYKKLLPEHKIVGFNCNSIIGANGAIHCITKLVMGDPLSIAHEAITEISQGAKVTLNAQVESHNPMKNFGVKFYWKNRGEQNFQSLPMDSFDGKNYQVTLPEMNGIENIDYYIQAEDVQGMYETLPEDAQEESSFFEVMVK